MTIPTTSLPSSDGPSSPLLSVFLPTALTLATVLGLGVWLLRDGGSNAPMAAPTVEQRTAITSQKVPAGAETSGRAALEDGYGQGWQPSQPYVVYLVSSTEHAEVLRQSIAEPDAARVTVGAPSLPTAILVIGAGDEHILRGLGAAAAIRDSLGLPELVMVDLRTPA